MPIASMTAFARQGMQGEWGTATWEVRSVNHRYLEVNLKIPDAFREWEQLWRQTVTKKLHRGRVDCFLTYFSSQQAGGESQLNRPLLKQLMAHCDTVMQYPQIKAPLNAMDILRWPEILLAPAEDFSFLKDQLTHLLEKTCVALEDSRFREGRAIVETMLVKLRQMFVHLGAIQERIPVCRQTHAQKIREKFAAVGVAYDPQRLDQELVLYVHRIDIEEERERLETHIHEMLHLLEAQKGPIGRRVDFLIQEMGREANTLASKSLQSEITREAIALKVLIEQLREQVQNME